jgi:hypothetical protein
MPWLRIMSQVDGPVLVNGLIGLNGKTANSAMSVQFVIVTLRLRSIERYVRIRTHLCRVVVIQSGALHRQEGCGAPKLVSSLKKTRRPASMPLSSAICMKQC